jgi:hypothetical protein
MSKKSELDNEFLNRAQVDNRDAKEVTKRKERAKKIRKAKEKKTSAFVQILNGDFLTKDFMLGNLTFIFFVMFLLLLTVSKGYYGKRLAKDVTDTQNELNELTSDQYEAKARLEEEVKGKKLMNELSPFGLKKTEDPTKVISIKKEQ